jgi:mannose/cellobiose epimerase-like protein (N-acyl-D-glucosamine 2-epimerase family)
VDAARRFAQWGLQTALPFWAAHGWDDVHGGFLESLALDGSPIRGEARRVRVQARQIYVFARAEHEGWFAGLDLAEAAASLLLQRAWQADGKPGWAHLLTDQGAVANPVRDLYDHAFILLALAWLGRATGKSAWPIRPAAISNPIPARNGRGARTLTCICSKPCWHSMRRQDGRNI